MRPVYSSAHRGSSTILFVYDEQGHLLGEYDATGNLIEETAWVDDLPVATLRPTGPGTPPPINAYYVHADQLGSPRAVTRPSDDAIMWQWDNVDPFGANLCNENPSGQGSFKYALRFPGQFYDAETGTHYNYFERLRSYDRQVRTKRSDWSRWGDEYLWICLGQPNYVRRSGGP